MKELLEKIDIELESHRAILTSKVGWIDKHGTSKDTVDECDKRATQACIETLEWVKKELNDI